ADSKPEAKADAKPDSKAAGKAGNKAAAKDDEEEEEESNDTAEEEAEVDTGPDPEEAARRFGAVADQLAAAYKAVEKHGRDHKTRFAELALHAALIPPIKLLPTQFH